MAFCEKAETLGVEAKHLLAKVLGEARSDYVRSLNNSANAHWPMGSHIETELVYVEARWLLVVETKLLRAKVLGEEHRDYASSFEQLGSIVLGHGFV